MRHLAAFMLAKLAGIEEPTAEQVSKILAAAEVEVDQAALKNVIESIQKTGKSYSELIESGKSKMAKLPTGGAAPAAAVAEVKEEAKKEKTEEEQIVAGFAFGASSSSEDESS
uniref:Putative 60S acidic ribosomal protein P2 n=1 Tax=Trepomonas sp. PC1 TaxID=1076344 RepID=A0A146KC01_9EUKA|eukprot:JAP94340.1 Putative 60S acidic ribosomal protein P2 [Trepomonas sp. PC1]